MKKPMLINNERGVALLMVLLIATITLAVTSTMLYMLTQSTRYSGMQKRHATAQEAAMAGTRVAMNYILNRGELAFKQEMAIKIGFEDYLTEECQKAKIQQNTSFWPACSSTLQLAPGDTSTYDNSFILGNYKVSTKIVYTFEGNTQGGSKSVDDLGGGGGVTDRFVKTCVVHCGLAGTGSRAASGGIAGEIQQQVFPATYVIEVDAVNTLRTTESAKLSVLFQF
jgi:Tfp pilus assembly protein PilX